jgi:hypothetical protein
VNADRLALIGPVQLRGIETPVQLCQNLQDVLACPERICAKVRTRTVRVRPFAAAYCDTVCLARNGAAEGVIRPRPRRGRTVTRSLCSATAVGSKTYP